MSVVGKTHPGRAERVRVSCVPRGSVAAGTDASTAGLTLTRHDGYRCIGLVLPLVSTIT